MAQLAIKNLSKLAPFAGGGPRNLPHKFHLYLIVLFWQETKRGNSENDSKVIDMLRTSYQQSKKRDQDRINELKEKIQKLVKH